MNEKQNLIRPPKNLLFTPRQIQALRHISTGQSYQEVVTKLNLTVKSDSFHLCQMQIKGNLNNTLALVRYALFPYHNNTTNYYSDFQVYACDFCIKFFQ